ncbi:MAG: hypothetical protein ACFB10_19320 [Salibacteraceae bacterium]
MKSFIAVIICFGCVFSVGFAQSANRAAEVKCAQTIKMTQALWGYKFIQNGEKISYRKLARLMKKENEAAHHFMRRARINKTIGVVTTGAMFGLVALEISLIALHGEVNPESLLSSLCLASGTLWFIEVAEDRAVEAVQLYNQSCCDAKAPGVKS